MQHSIVVKLSPGSHGDMGLNPTTDTVKAKIGHWDSRKGAPITVANKIDKYKKID